MKLSEAINSILTTNPKTVKPEDFIIEKKKKETASSLKPPKKWFNKMKKKIRRENLNYSEEQAEAIVGKIWYKNMSKMDKKNKREAEGKKFGKAPEDK